MVVAGEEALYAPVPYEADEFTLHLWHLDEEGVPFRDEGPVPTQLLGLHHGAQPGQPSLQGLGSSISFHHHTGGPPGSPDLAGAVLTASEVLANGPVDRAPASFRYFGADGAFTYEALIKLDLPPDEAQVIALSILSMDGEEMERIFNFRIERQGFLTFNPLMNSGAKGGAMATIPSDGPHGLNTEDWFHVAVTYNGHQGTPGNMSLYWTRMGAGAVAANLIGRGTLSADLNGRLGDLAIGNEARAFGTGRTAEPFPGRIDEVRISSVARHPSDFLFVPSGRRVSPEDAAGANIPELEASALRMDIVRVLVDGNEAVLPSAPDSALTLPPGLHRLDFDLGVLPARITRPVVLHCQLEGLDETWRKAELGMSLVFEVLDAGRQVVSQTRFQAIGTSSGWDNRIEESTFSERSEPLFIPPEGKALRVTLDSGSPDTTGRFAIGNLKVTLAGASGGSFWPNPEFRRGVNLTSPAGVPSGWTRGGRNPALAQVLGDSRDPALALVDADQNGFATWSAEVPLDPDIHAGETVVTAWQETYSIIGGNRFRASYLHVPDGLFTFRAVGLVDGEPIQNSGIALPVRIRPPVWLRPWFWPLVAAGAVSLVAVAVIRGARRRSRRRLRELWIQKTLESDRTRIARDLHDDLGTRLSGINMTASLANREIDQNPEKARVRLRNLGTSAQEMISAMDQLVWAVDPSHDSLEHLASHLTRLAEGMFRDSAIRCRFDIPAEVPDHQLGSDFRHHLSLAVKEALNNVLKHAGPCEVHLSLSCEDGRLVIEVRDTGAGFDPDAVDPARHGLRNLDGRLRELGGTCEITSSAEEGTRISFACPLPKEAPYTLP